jgi:Xaa-Pro aminopeptidase
MANNIMNLARIQEEIRKQKLDGWLFFDHHNRDLLAYRVLGLPVTKGPSRRWYYMIPAEGEPKGMEHRIERNQLAGLPGEKIAYSSWPEQAAALKRLTAGMKRVAMQYSPMCAVPYVSNVDAGTVELVRSMGVDVVSSAELIQIFEAMWTPAQLESHMEAGRRVDKVRAAAFEVIKERTRNGVAVQEVEIKDFVRSEFAKAGLLTDSGPIVGCNANASNPHYEPSAEITVPIKPGDWVLLDMWAKLDQPGVLRHHVDGVLRRQSDRRDAQGLRDRDRRSRCGDREGAVDHRSEAEAVRLRSRRCLPRCHQQQRIRRVFHASHRPLDRRGGARQRRQHGQFRNP